MKLSLSQISTINASFEEDVTAYAAAGFDGIGIWEMKLPGDDEANRTLLREAGLTVANAVPSLPSILQLGIPGMEGPFDPTERIESICASVRRLAAYEPAAVYCLTGPPGSRSESEARQIVLEGLQAVASTAREAGVPFGLEPIRASSRERTTIVTTIGEAVALLDEAGLEDVGILLDTYNVGDTPTVIEDVARFSDRIVGVQVADAPAEDPDRGDRVLPGEGSTPTKSIVQAVAAAGWDGFLDVEIFSTPDRFWGLPVEEAARRAFAAASALLD
jgi:sugar phosphate isomerase/epimerase